MSQIMPPPILPPLPPQQAWPVAEPPRSNTPALLALIFGLATLVLSVFASIPAIVCGIMGMIAADKPGVGRGKGMAVAGIVLAVVIPLGQAALLYPALLKARSQATQVASMSNLRMISVGVIMYANDHKGYLPPDLQTTYKYVKSPKVFRHPANQRPVPNPQNLDAESDYVYVYSGKTDPATGQAYRMSRIQRAAQCIALHEKLEFARDGRILVAFLDGHVERITLAEFKAQLAKRAALGPER